MADSTPAADLSQWPALAATDVGQLLGEIHRQRKSGTLQIVAGEARKSIFFRDGLVMFAESNLASERMGEILCRRGQITRAQLSEALKEASRTNKLMGTTLVERGYLQPEQLLSALEAQVNEIVTNTFGWVGAQWGFQAGIFTAAEGIVDLRIRPASLILAGAKLSYTVDHALSILGSRDAVPERSDAFDELTSRLAMDLDTARILKKIDGRRSIAALVAEAGIDELSALQVLAALQQIGALAHSTEVKLLRERPARAASVPGPTAPAAPQTEVTELLRRLPPFSTQLVAAPHAEHDPVVQASGRHAIQLVREFQQPRRILDVLQEHQYALEVVRSLASFYEGGILRDAAAVKAAVATPAPTPVSLPGFQERTQLSEVPDAQDAHDEFDDFDTAAFGGGTKVTNLPSSDGTPEPAPENLAPDLPFEHQTQNSSLEPELDPLSEIERFEEVTHSPHAFGGDTRVGNAQMFEESTAHSLSNASAFAFEEKTRVGEQVPAASPAPVTPHLQTQITNKRKVDSLEKPSAPPPSTTGSRSQKTTGASPRSSAASFVAGVAASLVLVVGLAVGAEWLGLIDVSPVFGPSAVATAVHSAPSIPEPIAVANPEGESNAPAAVEQSATEAAPPKPDAAPVAAPAMPAPPEANAATAPRAETSAPFAPPKKVTQRPAVPAPPVKEPPAAAQVSSQQSARDAAIREARTTTETAVSAPVAAPEKPAPAPPDVAVALAEPQPVPPPGETATATKKEETPERRAARIAKAKQEVARGKKLMEDLQPEDAEKAYRKAAALDPKNPDAFLGLGSIYDMLGQSRRAKVAYQAFLRLAPDHAYAEQVRSRLTEIQ